MNYFFILYCLCLLPTAFSQKSSYNLDLLDDNESGVNITPLVKEGKVELPTLHDKKRGSISNFLRNKVLPKFSRSSQSSLPSTPRTSINSQRSSSTSDCSIDSSDFSERQASGDFSRPSFLSSFLALSASDPVDWNTLNQDISLSEDHNSLIEQYFRVEGCGRNEEFKTKVRKTLAFIKEDFKINPFILNLAIKLVQKYDEKAPNALKLFLESKFAFMKTVMWDASKIESLLINTPGYSAELFQDPTFKGHLQTLFLDMLNPNALFAEEDRTSKMFMLYMELFNNATSETVFRQRFACMVDILIRMAADRFGKAKVTNDHVENIFTHNFNNFYDEIPKLF